MGNYSKKQKKELEIDGFNIYFDSKGRKVYYDNLTKQAYILNKSDAKMYYALSLRWPVAIAAAVLLTYYDATPWYISVAIGLAIFFGVYIYFRLGFLKKKAISPNFKKPAAENFIIQNARKAEFYKLVILILLSAALSIISYFNVKQSNFTGMTLYANYLLIIAAAGASIYYIVLAIIKKKNNL